MLQHSQSAPDSELEKSSHQASLRLVAVVGPTSVGKTDLALQVAARIPVEIVSADSRQVYRRMDIGTAKPTKSQLAAVPHHLIDVVDPDDDFSLGQYVLGARLAIKNANDDGKLPILVGGTGQYVMAIMEGWDVPSVPPNPELRRTLEEQLVDKDIAALFDRLREIDPVTAARIDSRNPRRIIRAIELAVAGHGGTGVTRRRENQFDSFIIGLNMGRDDLYRRTDDRVDQMMRRGFLAEVAALLDAGYSPELPSMSGIGYRELAEHLTAGTDLSEAVQRIKFRTHRYIRQQGNWFKREDPRIRWFDAEERSDAVDAALSWAMPQLRT